MPVPRCGEWGHVRLFSSWSELVDPAAGRLLDAAGTWTGTRRRRATRPAATGATPTCTRWRTLLDGLAGGSVRYGTRVVGVSRAGRDLLVDSGREGDPFTVHVDGPAGRERLARQRRRRRLRHLDQPQPARRRRLPRPRRDGERRPHHLRHPRLPRPRRRRPVRRQARRGRRQGRLGPERPRRPRPGRQDRPRHPRVVAAAPPVRGRRVRRRRQRPARAARQARPGRQGRCRERAGDQRDPVPHRVRRPPRRTAG